MANIKIDWNFYIEALKEVKAQQEHLRETQKQFDEMFAKLFAKKQQQQQKQQAGA